MGSLAAAGAFAGACYWLSIYPARPPSCIGRVMIQHLISVSSQPSVLHAPIGPIAQLCIPQSLMDMHLGGTHKPRYDGERHVVARSGRLCCFYTGRNPHGGQRAEEVSTKEA